jgi:hypothetical protein
MLYDAMMQSDAGILLLLMGAGALVILLVIFVEECGLCKLTRKLLKLIKKQKS